MSSGIVINDPPVTALEVASYPKLLRQHLESLLSKVMIEGEGGLNLLLSHHNEARAIRKAIRLVSSFLKQLP